MKTMMALLALFVLISIPLLSQDATLEGFVTVPEGTYYRGRGAQKGPLVRIETFEILDHPVTNAEYKKFTDGTGYAPPLHWEKGVIPSGKEDYPVIFVNRVDVKAFLNWISEKEQRAYRLPTTAEFEFAARGALPSKQYPWGDGLPDRNVNYDKERNRPFDSWATYLKPAKWGNANKYRLFGMAGNVWQMAVNRDDPATRAWMYRIDDPFLLENSVMGGSWARSEAYLVCGYSLGVSAGIRHPDIGFRPVREPFRGAWDEERRKLCAVSLGEGRVLLSWAFLQTDPNSTGFDVYRSEARNHAGFRLNQKPVVKGTTYVDEGLESGKRYHYYVRPVDSSGKSGERSEWTGITVSEKNSVVVSFEPVCQPGSLVPVFGDVNGDGLLDCVIRMDNGNNEMSQDPGIPVQLEVFTSYGRSLWRRDICRHDHCYGSANNVPFNVWDMDNDGRCEVITRLQIGDSVFVAILDGLTGNLRYKTKWPDMVTDLQKSSTRIHLSIAYLDGTHPSVITQTGLYENEVFVAYDRFLNRIWEFDSFAETNGSGGHKIEVRDVDGDGKQEVFNGTTCLNPDGTVKWSVYRLHPDIVSIHDCIPMRPGLEVFYIVESSVHAGIYMVDARSGDIIWKMNREDDPRWTHAHTGWTADIFRTPGMECVSNRAGHDDRNWILVSAEGDSILEPFPYGVTPLEWDGDGNRELLDGRSIKIGDFNGKEIVWKEHGQPVVPEKSRILMVADLYGDFRDELILIRTLENEKMVVSVATALEPIEKRYISATESLDYHLWLGRNMGGGYRSIYDQGLIEDLVK